MRTPLVLLSAVLVRALSMRLGQNLLTIVVEALVVAFEEARERAAERDEARPEVDGPRPPCWLPLWPAPDWPVEPRPMNGIEVLA